MSNDQDIKAIIALETDQKSATETIRVLADIQEELIALTDLNREFANSTSNRTLTDQQEELATLTELNREFIQSSISYLEQFEDTSNQIITPMQDLKQVIEDIEKSTSNIAIPPESLETFSEFSARLQEAREAGKEIDSSFFSNSDYYAERIAELEKLQNTAEELIPSVQQISENLSDVSANTEAIRIPREDIFDPIINSAQVLAEETKKASEEAKELGANLASSITVEADPRAIEAVKTLENTTKAIDELRKSNLISRQAWGDAANSARQLYSAMEEVRQEIDALSNAEIDLHNTEKVTQHRREIVRLQSNYETLKQTLNSLPEELAEGLREATRENEKLAQSFAQHEQRQSRSSSSLNPITDLVTNPLIGGSLLGGNLGIVNDLQEVIETLPQLGDAVKGIPGALSSVVTAIGNPIGIGMLGAIGALAIGIKLFTDEARRQEEELAELREIAKRSSEDATQAGLSGLQIYAQVMADGTVAAAEVALKNANKQLEVANIIDEKLSDIINNTDEMNYIKFMGVYSQTELGTELNLDLASQLASEGDEMFIYLLDAIEKIKPGLDAAGISVDEFIKDTGAGLELIRDAQRKNNLEMQQAEATINLVTSAVNSGVLALNSLEEIQKMITDRRLEDAERVRATTMEEAQLSKASSAELENRLNILELEELALQKARAELMNFGEETEEIAKQISTYTFQLIDNQRMQEKIANDYLDTAKQRELAAEIENESAQAVIKYNRDAQAVRDQYERSKVASEQKLSDDLIRIEDRRIQQIERAQEQLIERQEAINLKASREEQDQASKLAHERQQQAVKIEREELKAEMDHARKVRDIREKSAQQEFNLLLKRDFAGLFALRQRTDQEIKTAERASDEATKAREQARGEQAQDEMAKLAFEREQRQTRYQREIADAHAQAQRTQQQAQATADRELQLANDKHQAQLRMLHDQKWQELGILKKSIHDEVAELQRGRTARVRAEMQTQSALLQAQQIGMMNRVNAQPIYQLPVGYGNRNSVVNNNSANNTFNINGNNLSAMRQVVMNVLQEIWSK
jgi:hypothetical protein